MTTINPYLVFNGTCEEAFNFYRSVFGGDFKEVFRFKDMPPAEKEKFPESSLEKLMHISLPLSDKNLLMGSDANPMYEEVRIGQNVSLSVDVDSREDAERIFNKLAVGGKITMPLADTFWNAYFGMLTDKYLMIWMVSYYPPR